MSRRGLLAPVPGSAEIPTPDMPDVADRYDDGIPSMSRCEIDPEMYRIFAHAVLGWHRRLPKAAGDRCRCGKAWLDCEYVDLADKLLWTGAGAWRTGPA